MGFCDLCGMHGDYYDQMIMLGRTKLKKHSSNTLLFVCSNCYERLEKYESNRHEFDNFHFSNQVNEDKYKWERIKRT